MLVIRKQTWDHVINKRPLSLGVILHQRISGRVNQGRSKHSTSISWIKYTQTPQIRCQYSNTKMAYNFKDMPQFRPAEIATYHSETYERISPSNSTFDAKGKTLFITAGGKF